MADDATSYDALLLVDLNPPPNYQHASYENIAKCGIDKVLAGTKLKLSRSFRLRPLSLPIYENRHKHHVVAKIDARCNTSDRQAATRFVNEHIRNTKRANITMDAIILSVVETFPSRVVKGLNYDAKNEPISKFGTSSRRKIQTQFSSSDTDTMHVQASERTNKLGTKKKQKVATAVPTDTPYTVTAPAPVGKYSRLTGPIGGQSVRPRRCRRAATRVPGCSYSRTHSRQARCGFARSYHESPPIERRRHGESHL